MKNLIRILLYIPFLINICGISKNNDKSVIRVLIVSKLKKSVKFFSKYFDNFLNI